MKAIFPRQPAAAPSSPGEGSTLVDRHNVPARQGLSTAASPTRDSTPAKHK
jgi:hypothetical protein